MGFIKTIIILLAIYFLFKLVVRGLLPYLLKTYIQKKQQEFQQGQQNVNRKPEGEITIEYNKEKKKKGDDGDFVDYEEIK
ncbi:MAG: DUF4834 domain-containing protein [Bacteroidota bacterium]|nr:DUF4834 domain-containing protein [Bacteroidota bacterium]